MKRRKLKETKTNGKAKEPAIRGRPSTYGSERAVVAGKCAKYGLTDFEIADVLGVSVSTIYKWLTQYEDFAEALKIGKELPDERVKRSLFHRAVGYSFEAKKIFCNKDGDVTEVPYIEHVPPDTTAAIFWLKNRDAANWRESGSNGSIQGEEISIQNAPIQLLARVFGVAERIARAEEKTITVEAEASE